MAKKKKDFTKAKKKKWIEIVAPIFYNKQIIGESYVQEATNLINRQVKVNLMTLTRDIKKQNINAVFIIKDIKENKAFTKMIGYRMIPAALKRMIRRKKNKIESSIIMKSKDDIEFRIKPLAITHNKVSNSVATDIRRKYLELLKDKASKTNYENLIFEILGNKIQKDIKYKLSKIAPMRTFDIRAIKEVVKRTR